MTAYLTETLAPIGERGWSWASIQVRARILHVLSCLKICTFNYVRYFNVLDISRIYMRQISPR